MKDPFDRPSIRTGVFYRNPDNALAWLEKAFGFCRSIDVRDRNENLVHAEMTFGNSSIVVDSEWSEFVASPLSVDGRNTQIIYVQLDVDIDVHCQRARAAGADIIQEPTTEFYGDRLYRVRDLEGHIWTFSQAVSDVGRSEAERLGNVKISGWHRD